MPVALLLVFMLLFAMFGNVKDGLLIEEADSAAAQTISAAISGPLSDAPATAGARRTAPRANTGVRSMKVLP